MCESGAAEPFDRASESLYNEEMEDHRLKAFCLIVEMKSFSKAAEAKFMTQSAMSHLIKNLEDELGVKLLNRDAKTVSPTPAGRRFYEHAKKILDSYRAMESAIYTLVHTVKGDLSVGAGTTVATDLLHQVLYNFCKAYPEVRVALTISSTERVIGDLREGRTDTAIVGGYIRNSGLFVEEIAKDEMVIVASDDNPLVKKKKIIPQDLLSQPFIMPEPGSGAREFLEEFLRELKADPDCIAVSMTLGNPELIVRMVQSGLGISLVSKWSVFRALKEGTVKLLHLPGKKFSRGFYLVNLSAEPTSLVAGTFREFVKGFRFFVPF